MVFDGVKFLLFLFFFVFLPGRALIFLAGGKFNNFENKIIAFGVGVVLLVFLSSCLGWLGLRFLLLPSLLLSGLWFLWQQKEEIKIDKELNWGLFLILTWATVFQSLVMLKSGTSYQGGIAFWGVHGHDGVWHLTLIQELAQNFPGQNPGFAGRQLQNYHYFFDLFAAEVFRITRIKILNLYFRFLPLFLAFLLNSLVFIFAKRFSGKKSVGFWAIFFVSFASSFGFLLPFFGLGSNNWETAFWAMQPATSLQNPPFFMSLVVLMTGLNLFLQTKKKDSLILMVILALVFGSIVEFKVYGGLVILASLFMLGVWNFLQKRELVLLKLFALTFLVSLIIYLPTNQRSTTFVKLQFFWFIRTMIQAGDRMNWPSWELRRQTYFATRNYISLFTVEIIAFLLFLFGNLGTRIVGLLTFIKKLKKGKLIDLLLILIFLAGFFPTLVFIQKYLPWNIIQFFYYSIFVSCFFAGIATVKLFSKVDNRLLKLGLIIVLVVFSIPGSLKTISWHWGKIPTTILDQYEKQALAFLEKNSQREDKILVYPYLPDSEKKFNPPVPISYYNTAYVSFFTNRRVYLEDQTAALIQGYGFEQRYQDAKEFFNTPNASWANEFLNENSLDYVYLVDNQSWQADLENKLELVFKNRRCRIYRVVKSLKTRCVEYKPHLVWNSGVGQFRLFEDEVIKY